MDAELQRLRRLQKVEKEEEEDDTDDEVIMLHSNQSVNHNWECGASPSLLARLDECDDFEFSDHFVRMETRPGCAAPRVTRSGARRPASNAGRRITMAEDTNSFQ